MPHLRAKKGSVPTFLNVIFHGPFVFAIYSNRIEVLAADIKEHIVGAGTFQSERPCPPDVYSLIGVTPNPTPIAKIDPGLHLILDASKTKFQISPDSYYRFILQAPFSMTPLGLLSPDQPLVFLGRDEGSITNPPKFGSAHAFTYKIETDDQQQLENVQWTPVIQTVGKVNSISLHIFAESPYLLDLLHPNRDFSSLVA